MTVKELEVQAALETDEEKAAFEAAVVWRTRYRALKTHIWQLGGEQLMDKAIMRLPNNGRGSPELAARTAEPLWLYIYPQYAVHHRSLQLTAALNLHHEMRGSEHRHVIHDAYHRRCADTMLETLRKEIESVCAST